MIIAQLNFILQMAIMVFKLFIKILNYSIIIVIIIIIIIITINYLDLFKVQVH